MGNMNCGYALLEKEANKPLGVSDSETEDETDQKGKSGRGLLCAWCGNVITAKESAIEKNGSYDHTFANPGGHVFNIGCFRFAPGCFADLVESGDFAWFAGYVWSAAVCARCKSHLGWRFRSEEDTFFGLILDRLVEKDRPED